MRRDHVQPVGSQLDRQEPGKRGQRHDLPASAMNEEFSRVGGVAPFKRPGVANIAPLVPATAVDMAIRHRFAQRLRAAPERSEEHTSELQSLMRIPYDVLCLQNTKCTEIHKST